MTKPNLQLQPAVHRANIDGTGLFVIVNAAGDQYCFHSGEVAQHTLNNAAHKCDLYFYSHDEIRDAIMGEKAVATLINRVMANGRFGK